MVGIEPTSKSVSGKEHYVCSHIGASDGCEKLVNLTKPGDFFKEIFPTSSPLVLIPEFPVRTLYLSFVIGIGPSNVAIKRSLMQPLQIRCFQLSSVRFLQGLLTNLDTHSVFQAPLSKPVHPQEIVNYTITYYKDFARYLFAAKHTNFLSVFSLLAH